MTYLAILFTLIPVLASAEEVSGQLVPFHSFIEAAGLLARDIHNVFVLGLWILAVALIILVINIWMVVELKWLRKQR